MIVGIIMGFKLDWLIMKYVVEMFDQFGVVYEIKVVFVY